MPNIECLKNKVLVKPLPRKERTSGGIIIADVVTQNPLVEAVVEVVSSEITTLKPGDLVLHPKGAGTEHEFDGQKFIFMTDNDIWSIIK
jgi:chaperonin GroES